MFLRCTQRKKDGKEHRYLVDRGESSMCGRQDVQRPVLYLGEVNDSQREGWCRVIETFDEDRGQQRALALFCLGSEGFRSCRRLRGAGAA